LDGLHYKHFSRRSWVTVSQKTFLAAAAAAARKTTGGWCDGDETLNYMQLTFDNFKGHPYQLSGLNSDYAGRLGWVTELVSL
jgi:hypothetical protein